MSDHQYAIVIPAWNEAAFIASCIASAQQAMNGVAYSGQLIVVDNNSTDDTSALASNLGAQVVFEPFNQIARARNAGAAAANAEHYVFVDADTHISAALLDKALTLLLAQKTVGGGVCIRGDRPAGFAPGLGIKAWNWASRRFNLAAGCFVYTRADAFHQVGGFTLKRYAGEELDLSRRLRAWGKPKGMTFHIIDEPTVETSLRKLDWYSPGQLFGQMLLAMMPWGLHSKRFMNTWYDERIDRQQHLQTDLRDNQRNDNKPKDDDSV